MNRLEIEVANRGDITTIDGFLNKKNNQTDNYLGASLLAPNTIQSKFILGL